MKDILSTSVGFIMIVFLFVACKQAYEPAVQTQNIRLLVVEGFINGGQGPTTILLSRTGDLQDQSKRPEVGAQVKVEGDDGSAVLLVDSLNGKYNFPQLSINNNVKYRLHIRTADGREYASDYTPVRRTPPIDSVTWQMEDGGVRLYVNTHDPQSLTKYYQWKFDETWEIHSAYYSALKYLRDGSGRVKELVWRDPNFHSVDTTIYKCWSSLSSTSIILGSSENLSADVIYLPVHYIEPGSEKLSVLYSINLKQYAMSQDAYLFMQKMKKNTEQVGTLFDAQPSQISGNFKCLTNPNELVIGFVEVTDEQTKRIFIYNSQVPGWGYRTACMQLLILNNVDSINVYGAGLFPTYPNMVGFGGAVIDFYAATMESCIDCTTRGVNRKPAFWP
jgi:uncharacterized protein DUF4249